MIILIEVIIQETNQIEIDENTCMSVILHVLTEFKD